MPVNFLCPRQPGGLTLSPSSCADLYQRGKRAEKWQTAYHCRGCEIGAGHAGEQVVKIQEVPAERCESCGAGAHRLVFGSLCVSCYNRMAEAMKGRNARGREPKKWRAIRAGDLVWIRCGKSTYVSINGKVARISRGVNPLPSAQCSLFDTM